MTVTYTLEVATSKLGRFLQLLLRWRGSIYKLVWREFLIFVLLYYILNLVYRFAMPPEHRRKFERLVKYCESYGNMIPVSFVLGFYVTLVVGRWWSQFCVIPWPDRLALFVSSGIQGQDDRGRLMRRTIMRYICLCYVITMSSISPPIKKRFPTFTHMTEAGFMLPNEQHILEEIKTSNNKYFIPLIWSTSLVTRARKEGRIKDDFAVKTIIDEINSFRGNCGTLLAYDWISIPLVYTQVVTLATYSYFLSSLLGHQLVQRPNVDDADMYVPVFVFLQFFFYMGWLKVAESLVNPFGEDDDDFDINGLVDRNLQVSYLVVDEMHQEHPELIKDQYWDTAEFELPYTAASEQYQKPEPFIGSTADIRIDPEKREFVTLESVIEGNEEDENGFHKSFSTGRVEIEHSSPADIPPVAASAPVDHVIVGPAKASPANRLRQFFRSLSNTRSHKGSNLSLVSATKKTKRRGSASSADTQGLASSFKDSHDPDDIFVMHDISGSDDTLDGSRNMGSVATPKLLARMRNQSIRSNTSKSDPKLNIIHKSETKLHKGKDVHKSKEEMPLLPSAQSTTSRERIKSQISETDLEPIEESFSENRQSDSQSPPKSK